MNKTITYDATQWQLMPIKPDPLMCAAALEVDDLYKMGRSMLVNQVYLALRSYAPLPPFMTPWNVIDQSNPDTFPPEGKMVLLHWQCTSPQVRGTFIGYLQHAVDEVVWMDQDGTGMNAAVIMWCDMPPLPPY